MIYFNWAWDQVVQNWGQGHILSPYEVSEQILLKKKYYIHVLSADDDMGEEQTSTNAFVLRKDVNALFIPVSDSENVEL